MADFQEIGIHEVPERAELAVRLAMPRSLSCASNSCHETCQPTGWSHI